MPKYHYKALKEDGKRVSGTMQAQDEGQLYQKLRAEGLAFTGAKAVGVKKQTKKLKALQLSDFCRQIGTLTGSGVSLVRAINIMVQDESIKPAHRAIYEDVLRLVRQGIALSDAMEQQGGAFPELLTNMFRAAEESGGMDKTALRLARHYDKDYRLQAKVKSSTTYPKILCFLIVVVVVFMMGFVLPSFEDMFSQMETLPLPTRILFGISDLVTEHWLILLVLVVILFFVIRIILMMPKVRLGMDRIKTHLPLFGKLWRTIYTARFARTLSSLYSAGIPIVAAMQVAKKTVGNLYIESQFEGAIAFVRGGGNLSEAIDQIDGFVPKMTSSIRVGEETGGLDAMLDTIADTLEYESEMAINKMVSYMEPALIIAMAVIVGFIMVAVMMPIYGSYNSIESSSY